MASTSRVRAAASTCTGRRASRAIHSTYGSSSSSIILDPLPSLPQSVTRPLHAHLQCRYTHSGERRHLLVAQLFYVLQQECFAEQWIQLVKHTLHELFVLSRPRRPLVRRVQ